MKVCEECKGTGTVTLFTTSGPCRTCTRARRATHLKNWRKVEQLTIERGMKPESDRIRLKDFYVKGWPKKFRRRSPF